MRAFLVLSVVAMAAVGVSGGAAASEKPAPVKTDKPACNDHRVRMAESGKAIGARRLGQEPDAQHIAAVVRTLDGCSRPIVLTEKVGFRGL
ncbi:hypothetical protein [Sphingomonas sp. 28-62-11]|uniref:hypothetical protein n=1 Tax=Sphingomonas sp. 28-62-11 TaxID=1970432 RepID=UPI000BD66D9B|nr:MAG: hypothetical protein B7Y49_10750 [Sphingomonas sp. 28-62-11]